MVDVNFYFDENIFGFCFLFPFALFVTWNALLLPQLIKSFPTQQILFWFSNLVTKSFLSNLCKIDKRTSGRTENRQTVLKQTGRQTDR
jgi:hypothetical protein